MNQLAAIAVKAIAIQRFRARERSRSGEDCAGTSAQRSSTSAVIFGAITGVSAEARSAASSSSPYGALLSASRKSAARTRRLQWLTKPGARCGWRRSVRSRAMASCAPTCRGWVGAILERFIGDHTPMCAHGGSGTDTM
eukprot:7390946-Prymnesium_polylepis.2